MRKLDVSPITDNSEFPVTSGTLQFLQDSYGELFSAMMTALIGLSNYNTNTVYVLYGCVNTGVAPNLNISAGVVFYNGELYYVNATSFTPTTGNVGIWQEVTTQYGVNADPATFSDLTVHNVHNIRMLQIVQGATGSGLSDYASSSFLSFTIPPKLNLTVATGSSYPNNIAQVVGTYPNLQLYTPAPATSSHPILAAGNQLIGDIAPGGGTTVTVTFTDIGITNYRVLMTLISLGTSSTDATISGAVINSSKTSNSFQVHFQEWASVVQDVSIDWIIIQP